MFEEAVNSNNNNDDVKKMNEEYIEEEDEEEEESEEEEEEEISITRLDNQHLAKTTTIGNNFDVDIDYAALAFLEKKLMGTDDEMYERMQQFGKYLRKQYPTLTMTSFTKNGKMYLRMNNLKFTAIALDIFIRSSVVGEIKPFMNDVVTQITKYIDEMRRKPTIPPIPTNPTNPPPPIKSKKRKFGEKTPPEILVVNKKVRNETNKSVTLFQIEDEDFYLMCRKRENVVDGRRNIEKRYGKTTLLKTWPNREVGAAMGKDIASNFSDLKWNARTNILTNQCGAVKSEQIVDFCDKYLNI